MKPILYIGLAASLALGACSSTYKTAQTPDDVYYSPRQQQRTYASSNGSNGNSRQDENDANYVQGNQEDGGNYVTYQDEDQGDYQRRLNRFGSGGSNYSGDYWDGYNAASNMYMMNSYGLGYGGFGWGYSPYSSFYGPSLSLGLGWGMGGFYSPWNSGFYGGWGYPYVGSYWPSYYYPYYGGGYYGGGYYGHGGFYGGGYYRTRPSNSYGPVRSSNDRVPRANYTNSGGTGGGGYSRPNRSGVFQPVNGNNGGTVNPGGSGDRPRRVFQQSNSERPVTRPVYQDNSGNGGNNNYSRPQRVEYSRPAPSPSPAPSYTPSSGGGRVGGSSGGSGGGGGYSRPSRGGR
ncbi:hypothetical protein ACTJJ0_22985 [Chitinophaga sp. 22321]|uniref:Vitellogenin II n=1 Tax=Chitinophaga hostae TaxID=2831022 RepID=A0ABS5J8A6_9BACT|nr:hypothetical protein [Chitinophaga hostae]MBS0031444.1 hypothetical protein [Chitinophaga hostae]